MTPGSQAHVSGSTAATRLGLGSPWRAAREPPAGAAMSAGRRKFADRDV